MINSYTLVAGPELAAELRRLAPELVPDPALRSGAMMKAQARADQGREAERGRPAAGAGEGEDLMAGVIYDPERRLLCCPHCSETEPSPGADDLLAHMDAMFKFAREHIFGCPDRKAELERQ